MEIPPFPEENKIGNLFLGLDFSTQQIKASVIDQSFQVIHEAAVHFDSELPEFRTNGGARKDGTSVVAPTIMWVKALDLLMDKLRITGLDFNDIAALSGAGQQHGSVYWRMGAEEVLKNLNPSKFLFEQLTHCFSIQDSPIWMDSSTKVQCEALEKKIGGPQKLANITGSRAYERFTGNQIAKIFNDKSENYFHTERISLVSSFACSLFLGTYAPIDWSDGSGMNLLDISAKTWNAQCLQACAPELEEKLSKPVPSHTCLGPVSPYFVDRYGFHPNCQVIAFTGDNPSSLAGMCLQPGEVAISLGTSDTLFLWLNQQPTPTTEGHVFCNPVDPDSHMALLCFKNGSLTRERIRNTCASRSWPEFNALLSCTPAGNNGFLGMYFDEEEIVPKVTGTYRFNEKDESISEFDSNAVEIRALIEGQFLAKRLHAERLGFSIDRSCRILATGGASNNTAILQVLSDVFGATVYTQDTANSCCLGSAYRAAHGLKINQEGQFIPFHEFMGSRESFRMVCQPNPQATEVYDSMVTRYSALELCILTNMYQ